MFITIFRHLAHHLFFVIAMVSAAHAYASDPNSEPEVVLIVGEEHFLRFELDEVINGFLPAAVFHGGISDEKRNKYTRKAVDVLIDRALLYKAAHVAGIRVEPEEVELVVEKNIEKFGSKEKFNAALEKSGLTLKRFKHRIVQQRAINEHIQSGLVKQSRYTKEELRAYYNDNQQEFNRPETIGLWHIILKVKPNAQESTWLEKKKLADSLVSRAKKGEDFTKLASEYSEGDYRVKGGWIGYMHKGRLLLELENVAFNLKKDAVSDPIRSLQGYHIIKAGDRKQMGIISFESASAGLKQRLEKERFEKLKTDLLNSFRETVEVKVLVDMP